MRSLAVDCTEHRLVHDFSPGTIFVFWDMDVITYSENMSCIVFGVFRFLRVDGVTLEFSQNCIDCEIDSFGVALIKLFSK